MPTMPLDRTSFLRPGRATFAKKMKLDLKSILLILVAAGFLIFVALNHEEQQVNKEKAEDIKHVLVKIYGVDNYKTIKELYNEPVKRFLSNENLGYTFDRHGILFNSSNEIDYIELRVALKNPKQNLPRLRSYVREIAEDKRIVIK